MGDIIELTKNRCKVSSRTPIIREVINNAQGRYQDTPSIETVGQFINLATFAIIEQEAFVKGILERQNMIKLAGGVGMKEKKKMSWKEKRQQKEAEAQERLRQSIMLTINRVNSSIPKNNE